MTPLACKKSASSPAESDTGDKEDEEGETTDPGTLALDLSSAYPEGLALSVLPAAIADGVPASLPPIAAGTVGIDTPASLLEEAYDPTTQTSLGKIEDAQAKLKGEEACFSAAILQAPVVQLPSCYTPDTDLDYDPSVAPHGAVSPRPTDTASGEACLAAYARAKAAATVAMVDRATNLILAMLCQSKKSGQDASVPAVGSELDLTDELKIAMSDIEGLDLTTAKLSRLDDKDGNPVIKSEIYLTFESPDGSHRLEDIHILHSPDATLGNTKYTGRLWLRSGSQRDGDQNPQTTYLALDYGRSGEDDAPRLQALLTQGSYVQDTATADKFDVLAGDALFDDQGHFDMSGGADFSGVESGNQLFGHWSSDTAGGNGLNNTMGSSQLIAFDINILTGAGRMSYWQNYGGNYAESARGMVFELKRAEGSDAMSGCVISGATYTLGGSGDVSIRKAQHNGDFAQLTPGGYYHPGGEDYHAPMNTSIETLIADNSYHCDEGLCQKAPFVYRQCFAQNDDGKYMIDTAAMDSADYQVLYSGSSLVGEIPSPDYQDMPNLSL